MTDVKHFPHAELDRLMWANTDTGAPGGCWLWTGHVHKSLDIPLVLMPRELSRYRKNPARLLYELYNGVRLGSRDHLKTTCANRRCVNPAHQVDKNTVLPPVESKASEADAPLTPEGDAPLAPKAFPDKVLGDRIWSRIDRRGACWLWLGSCGGGGNAQVSHRRKLFSVARLLWELYRGPLSKLYRLKSTCGNAKCVSPAHRLATRERASPQSGRSTSGTLCVNCGHTPANRARRLCFNCSARPDIREKYPTTSKYAARGVGQGPRKLAARPTAIPPNDPRRAGVYAERLRRGESPFHPLDAGCYDPTADEEKAIRAELDRRNAPPDREGW